MAYTADPVQSGSAAFPDNAAGNKSAAGNCSGVVTDQLRRGQQETAEAVAGGNDQDRFQ